VAARAAEVKSAQEPLPSPPAPIPPSPVPHVPPVAQPRPTVPSGPPVSSSAAGRIAAGTDTILAMRAARVAELTSSDPEIAAYDAALAAFGRIESVTIPSVLLPPAAKPAAPTNKGIQMNPQLAATLRSILLALGGAAVSKGVIDQNTLVGLVGGAVSALSYGWSLWTHSTTGTIAAAAALPVVSKIVTTSAIADSSTFAANPTVVSH
jgi:hypothetical protein